MEENFASSRISDEQQESDPVARRSVTVQMAEKKPLLPFDAAHWQAAEQYRIIRTKLVHHPNRPRMLAVSSAGPGDGKTVSAVNIAGALALRSNANILLVDADLRRAGLAKLLGAPSSPGLSDLLAGPHTVEECAVRLQPLENLYLLPRGAETDSPSELLDSERWPEICNELRRKFDFIVLDTPPAGFVADYELIQKACDGVIFVVRPDHTNRTLCYKALQIVPAEKLIGVVMNCAEEFFLQKTYGYNYYSYQQ